MNIHGLYLKFVNLLLLPLAEVWPIPMLWRVFSTDDMPDDRLAGHRWEPFLGWGKHRKRCGKPMVLGK